MQGLDQKFLGKELSNCQSLAHLSIKECSCAGALDSGSLASVLSSLPHFESLEWTGMEEATLKYGAINHLLRNRPMKFLAFDGIQRDEDLLEFFLLVKQSTSLRVLRCEMEEEGFSTAQLEELNKALAMNETLETLRINVKPDADLSPLAEILRTNRTLIGLHITGCVEPIPDLSTFAAALETSNITLKSLIIGSCNFGGVSASSTRPEKLKRIEVLLQGNIARSRPPPLPKPCYNPS